MGAYTSIEVLITVKAYPNPSQGVREASCIAGITRKGRFIRLYPIPFRDLESDQRFEKYQWIQVRVTRPKSDPRSESYRPDVESIKVVSGTLSRTGAWQHRREAILPFASPSLCAIQEAQRTRGVSLGLFRPAEVLDFDWEAEEHPDWTPGERALMTQGDLFRTRHHELLEKIPYRFRYRFRCQDCRAVHPHHVMVVDWELAQLFRRLRRRTNSIEECLRQVRDKWLGELCAPDRETCFFTGNMVKRPGSFLILGVFWPPRTEDQQRLFG